MQHYKIMLRIMDRLELKIHLNKFIALLVFHELSQMKIKI